MKPITLILHFLRLEIRTHSEDIHRWITNHYQSFDQSAAFPSRVVDCLLEIEEINSPDQLAMHTPTDGVFVENSVAGALCYFKDGMLYAARDDDFEHAIEFDLRNRILRANVGGRIARVEEAFLYSFFREVLKKLILPFSHIVTLHGAVVAKNQIAVFLAGDTGMGKSTTAIHLTECGYTILSDDSPLLVSEAGQALAFSSLDRFSVTESTLAHFPFLKNYLSGTRELSGKYFVDRECMPTPVYGPLVVTQFVTLKRGVYDKPRIFAVDKQEPLFALLKESTMIYRHPCFRESGFDLDENITAYIFDVISQLVNNAHVYALEFSDSQMSQLPDLLESAFAQLPAL